MEFRSGGSYGGGVFGGSRSRSLGRVGMVGDSEAALAARTLTLVPSCSDSTRQSRGCAVCVRMVFMVDGLVRDLLLHLLHRQRGNRTSEIPWPQSRFMFTLTYGGSKCYPSSPTTSLDGAIVRPGHVAIDTSSLVDNV